MDLREATLAAAVARPSARNSNPCSARASRQVEIGGRLHWRFSKKGYVWIDSPMRSWTHAVLVTDANIRQSGSTITVTSDRTPMMTTGVARGVTTSCA